MSEIATIFFQLNIPVVRAFAYTTPPTSKYLRYETPVRFMKIVLCPVSLSNPLSITSGSPKVVNALALGYLASALKANKNTQNDDVIILEREAALYTLKTLKKEILRREPDVLGISVYLWNYQRAIKLCEMIKQDNPAIVTVLGGPQVTYSAEEVLKENPSVDIIVRGEGEITFCALIEALKKDILHVEDMINRYRAEETKIEDAEIMVKKSDAKVEKEKVDKKAKEKKVKVKKEKVLKEKADIGVAFDGDGDRIGTVDEKGSILWNDVLVAIFSKEILERFPNSKIIHNNLCSQVVTKVVEKEGGTPIMWLTGHAFIKKKIMEDIKSY